MGLVAYSQINNFAVFNVLAFAKVLLILNTFYRQISVFCSENLQNGDKNFCKICSGISVDFRNSIFQNFPEKHAWTLLDKLAPSPLAELALTASFPQQSRILSPRPHLH